MKIFVTIFFALFLLSCSNLKYLGDHEALYTGATVKVEEEEKSGEKKQIKDELEALIRPRPNSSILGLRVKLYAWNIAGNPKKEKSPAAMLKRWGEEPVLMSDFSLEHNINVLRSHLENSGYFRAVVEGDTTWKNKKGSAEFIAKTGPQYTIREVNFPKSDHPLHKAIDSASISRRRGRRISLLKPGEPFNLDVIKDERDRIDAVLKQRGFFFFSADNLIMLTDSTVGEHQVDLFVNTKPDMHPDAGKKFYINDIFIFTNYDLGAQAADTSKENAKFHEGYYVVDNNNYYKPKLFQQALQFSSGEYYNRRDHNNTLNRLINLGIFKFVQNRFDKVGDTLLNAYYYITPMPKKSLRGEIGALTKSNNMTGSQFTLGFTNRNTFRGGEILTVDASAGFEVQFSSQASGFNTYRLGAEANLGVPRFIIPFIQINTRGGYVPRTNFQLGYDILTRQKLYTINSFKGGVGYIWKESIRKEHKFYPVSIQYVQPIKVSQLYKDSLLRDATLQKAIDTQFILGTNYNYNFNQLAGRPGRNAFYFNGNIDVAGNLAGLVTGRNGEGQKQLFGAPFSQYAKLEADFRYYRRLSSNPRSTKIWATRLIAGAGLPYGNSDELPFIKQFFIGGNNSLRGFRSRAVGPGTYIPPGLGTAEFIPDQSGDIKLEFNTELRAKLFSIVHGALFFDAGNIWLRYENTLKPGAKFSKDFMKEIAADVGAGIRLDVSILVLRLDVAIPVRKPYLPEGQRWVWKQIDFSDKQWRKENIIYNLGIGYPF